MMKSKKLYPVYRIFNCMFSFMIELKMERKRKLNSELKLEIKTQLKIEIRCYLGYVKRVLVFQKYRLFLDLINLK